MTLGGETVAASPAVWDVVAGLREWRLWLYMGLQDIRQRYRRSVIGPLWLVMGLGVTVFGIGLLYSEIFRSDPRVFVPFIAISLWVWALISGALSEGTAVFQSQGHIIGSAKVPYTSFVLRLIVRNMIAFGHGTIVVAIAFAWYRYPIGWQALAAIPGLLLILANLYWMVLLAGLVSARFRDAGQIIIYAVAIALFLTPIIWMPNAVRAGSPFIHINPLNHLISVVRGPLFEHTIPWTSFGVVTAMAIVGTAVALAVFARARRYLVYWI